MTMEAVYEADIDRSVLSGARLAVLGFGAQGRAHALNLRDSGADVVVGLRPGSASRASCAAAGLATATPEEAASTADLAVLLVPDEAQPRLYGDVLAQRLRPGAALVFAHGYNIHFGHIQPRADLDVILVAPLGIGDQVRATYERGAGVPALLAVHQDASGRARERGLAYAGMNGHGRAGVMTTTFAEETETDLFAEQAVLCGGVSHLITAAFDTLVEAGYPAELAYFGCLHELKLITDLIHARGIDGMRRSISSTAEFGDYTRGPRIIGDASRAAMREILDEIRNGRFDQELGAEMAAGGPRLAKGRAAAGEHAIETVGRRLRSMMPWLDDRGG
jgi:ketol-acid reductoisomerase